jgi:hypothetical protein
MMNSLLTLRFVIGLLGLVFCKHMILPSRASRVALPGVPNVLIVSPRFASGSEGTNEYCRMFRVDFQTQTNWIYGLESSSDLVHWQPCPPEIDGTGEPDYFFDADFDHKSYRLVLREGVLPEE